MVLLTLGSESLDYQYVGNEGLCISMAYHTDTEKNFEYVSLLPSPFLIRT